jgi:hypothetical protein
MLIQFSVYISFIVIMIFQIRSEISLKVKSNQAFLIMIVSNKMRKIMIALSSEIITAGSIYTNCMVGFFHSLAVCFDYLAFGY